MPEGMKEKELRERAVCNSCGKKVGACGSPFIWTVKIERHMVDMAPMKRQDGLTAMLGGNAMLANVMGMDEAMTTRISSSDRTVCDDCAMLTDAPGIAFLALEPEGVEEKESSDV